MANWVWPAIFTTILVPSVGIGIKFLISHWSDRKKEIEVLKAQRGNDILTDLNDQLTSLKTKIQMENTKSVDMMKALRSEIGEHKAMIMEQKGQISTVMSIFDSTLESARKIADGVDARVDTKIQTELIRIRDMIYVGQQKIKGDKDGK